MKKAIVIFGKSGSGKTVVADMMDKTTIYKKVMNTTSRPPRENEVDSVDYHFVTAEKFLELSAADEFIERAKHGEHYYGVQHDDFAQLDYGVMVLNVEGIRAIKELYPNEVVAVYLRVSRGLRYMRQVWRGDELGDIQRRIPVDAAAFEDAIEYVDHIIDCDKLSVEEVVQAILGATSNCK